MSLLSPLYVSGKLLFCRNLYLTVTIEALKH